MSVKLRYDDFENSKEEKENMKSKFSMITVSLDLINFIFFFNLTI